MKARYLVRLDDACPTMNAERWRLLERVLDDLRIRPIVAVVPQNLDPELQVGEPDPDFWDRVRSWQAKGWTIAMHGYQHVFHAVQRKRLVLPFHDRSEFAGLGFEQQARKMRASWSLFLAQGVEPTAWIAPAHSFDRETLGALARETPIRLVSDGIARDQYYDAGFYWLPQQLWAFRPQRDGLWTICLHPNTMTVEAIERLRADLSGPASRGLFTSVQQLELRQRPHSLADRLYAAYFWRRSHAQALLARVRSLLPRRRGAA